MDQGTFTPVLHVVPEMTDRCDRCGAAAKLRMALAEGGLAFCGHHANANADAIVRNAGQVVVAAEFSWVGAAALGAPAIVDGPTPTEPPVRAELWVAFAWKANWPRENWLPIWLKFCRLYSKPKRRACLP